jgi:hypothetical protein
MVDPKLLIGRNIALVSSQPVLGLCVSIELIQLNNMQTSQASRRRSQLDIEGSRARCLSGSNRRLVPQAEFSYSTIQLTILYSSRKSRQLP